MKIAMAVGLLFGPIAACMAFVITFGEYRKHFPDGPTAMLQSLQAAFVTLAFFVALACLLGWLLGQGAISGQGTPQ